VTRHVIRRLLAGAGLLVVLTLITYVVFFSIPVDPANMILLGQGNAEPTHAEAEAIRERFGLDRPMLVQYGEFLWRLVTQADLGRSFFYNRPVTESIRWAFPVTASLVGVGALFLFALAVPLAFVSASRPDSLVDRGVTLLTLVGIGVHPFIIGQLLRDGFSLHLDAAPYGGYCRLLPTDPPAQFAPFAGQRAAFCSGPQAWLEHIWLPALAFALLFLPLYVRMIRTRMLETLSEPYVLTARGKGASEFRVLRVHVLRNSLAPVLVMLAADAGTAITAAIYVETIFGMSGLGLLAVNALSGDFAGFDLPIIVGVVTTVAAAVVALNVAADLVAAALDPRIRTGGAARA
jgi:peptide/nickel transport system permease protein